MAENKRKWLMGEQKGKWLLISEAVEISRMSASAIRESIKAGTLPAFKPGKKVLIAEGDLEKFIRSSRID